MVANPPDRNRLRTLRQLGIAHAVHYDMDDLPEDRAELEAIRALYEAEGLALKIVWPGLRLTLLEPAIIIFMALMVGSIVMSVLMAVFDITSGIGK